MSQKIKLYTRDDIKNEFQDKNKICFFLTKLTFKLSIQEDNHKTIMYLFFNLKYPTKIEKRTKTLFGYKQYEIVTILSTNKYD